MVNSSPTSGGFKIGLISVSPHKRKDGNDCWRVNIPVKVVGERTPKFKPDQVNAATLAQNVWNAYLKGGPALALEALEHEDGPASYSGDGLPMSKVVDLYLEKMADKPGTPTLRNHLKKFSKKFGGIPCDEITARTVKKWLDTLKDDKGEDLAERTKYGVFGSCSQFWTWAVRYDFATKALFQKVEAPDKGESEIHIMTPDQMLLALKHSPNDYVTRWLVGGGFAWLRSCELLRMDGKDVGEEIFVREEVIKKTDGIKSRMVERTDAFNSLWPACSGRVIPVSETTFYYHTSRLAKMVFGDDCERWPHNCLRDSAATYYIAISEDASKLQHRLGHTTTATAFANYARRDVTKRIANEWWNIRREAVDALRVEERKLTRGKGKPKAA